MGNYYTLANARTDGLTVAEASDDAVNAEIALSEELLEKWTGRKFYAQTLTLNLDGTGKEWLDLSRYKPINSLTSLVIDGETVDIDNYIKIYSNPGFLRIARVGWSIYSGNQGYYAFSRGTQNIVIVGSFYGSSVPAPIKRIVRLMVFRQFRAKDKIGSYESEKTGDYNYKLNNSVSAGGSKGDVLTGDPEIDRMIRSYKHKFSFKAITRGYQ